MRKTDEKVTHRRKQTISIIFLHILQFVVFLLFTYLYYGINTNGSKLCHGRPVLRY